MNNEQLLNEWNAGNPVKGVIMGGFGTDEMAKIYDLAIWTLGMAILEQMIANPPSKEHVDEITEGNVNSWYEYTDSVEEKISEVIKVINPSNGMMGGGWNVAMVCYKHGYEKALTMVEEDRITTFSNVYDTPETKAVLDKFLESVV